jgi:hypothetical protein
MITARIAAIAFAVVSETLAAQQAQPAHISIRVTDVIGDIIPGARIQIDRAPGQTKIDGTTDRNGEAAVDILSGNHVISITCHAFEQLDRKIDVENGSDQNIAAVLRFGYIASPSIVASEEIIIPLGHPFDATEIPLIPAEAFPPPSRPLHHHSHRL